MWPGPSGIARAAGAVLVGEVVSWGALGLVGEGACCSPLGPAAAGAAEAIEPGAGFLGLCQPACTGSTLEASVGSPILFLPPAAATLEGLLGTAVAVAFAVLELELLDLAAVDPVSMSILMARACLSCSSLETIKQ